jgi:hypothetical protein
MLEETKFVPVNVTVVRMFCFGSARTTGEPVTTTLATERLVGPVAPMAAGVPAAVPANPPAAFVVMVQSFVPSTPPSAEPRITRVSPLA